jgi:hypothetical protein
MAIDRRLLLKHPVALPFFWDCSAVCLGRRGPGIASPATGPATTRPPSQRRPHR